MKTTNFFGWVGMALLLATGSCAKDPENFCEGWVEDTCQAIAGCCATGAKYDLENCRISLSNNCQSVTKVERVHAGEVIFNSGAASDCFGTIETCADLEASSSKAPDFEQTKACNNMLTGFRPLGAACDDDSDCERSGEFASCYGSANGSGVCVKVIVDEAVCSFAFESNELLVCPDGKFCDLSAFKPSPSAPPTTRQFEFSATCKPNIGSGGKCIDDSNILPCATGLYCDFTMATSATCTPRKASGTACDGNQECVEGLSCDSAPGSTKQTCQSAEKSGPYCFEPAVCGNQQCEDGETAASCPKDCGQSATCGDGICEGNEFDFCPEDCGQSGGCGDGFCDAGSGEGAFCPQDCCGDGTCDSGETATCPSDCQ